GRHSRRRHVLVQHERRDAARPARIPEQRVDRSPRRGGALSVRSAATALGAGHLRIGRRPGASLKPRYDEVSAMSQEVKSAAPSAGLTRLVRATVFSVAGLRAAWIHEAAFRQECWAAAVLVPAAFWLRSEEHTSELQSRENLVC